MKFAIRALGFFLGAIVVAPAQADLFLETLRGAAIRSGVRPVSELNRPADPAKSEIGGLLFESKLLSLNGDTSCGSCHLERFGSADGLPNAIGVGGQGEGVERLRSGGAIVPRNTLPLWGRGGWGFHTLFWDGKVQETESGVVSQFGQEAPSRDPLVVAAHLPFVELREMVVDQEDASGHLQTENLESARAVYRTLTERVQADPVLGAKLARAFGMDIAAIGFQEIAEAVAHHIRDRFALRATRFHEFLFGHEDLTESEVGGGLIFFGKGRCATCHGGPYFTDFSFHAIPFPQAGFGKNGFGIDYGRFNVTFDDRDLYKFRTPPLLDVARTGPYSHSGAIPSLQEAIFAHFDPLRNVGLVNWSLIERVEFYRRLTAWASSERRAPLLSEAEVAKLVDFLGTLSLAPRAEDRRETEDVANQDR